MHYLPQTVYFGVRNAYSFAYEGRTRNAYWVYERLTQKHFSSFAKRKRSFFLEDPLIPKMLRTSSQDYKHSGFDRGHLCPAGDRSYNEAERRETFFLTNISPQLPDFNRGYWKKLEIFVRKLCDKYSVLHVFTIPLYLPVEKEGKKIVSYEVIGEKNIAVPTHFAKVIITQKSEKQPEKVFSFLLPHQPISVETPLNEFKTTLNKIQQQSGLIFSVSDSNQEEDLFVP